MSVEGQETGAFWASSILDATLILDGPGGKNELRRLHIPNRNWSETLNLRHAGSVA